MYSLELSLLFSFIITLNLLSEGAYILGSGSNQATLCFGKFSCNFNDLDVDNLKNFILSNLPFFLALLFFSSITSLFSSTAVKRKPRGSYSDYLSLAGVKIDSLNEKFCE